MTRPDPVRQRRLDIIGQGRRLNRIAIARTGDTNEAHLIVHGVLARALENEQLASTVVGLDEALHAALAARRADCAVA